MSTAEGQEGMLYMREKSPRVHRGESHEMVFDSGVVEGYAKCLDVISEVIGVKDADVEDIENR